MSFQRKVNLFVFSTLAGLSVLAAPSLARAELMETRFALFAPALEGQLNVNTATETEWELLPGIGPSTAKKIVAYRKGNPFKEPIHVMRVKGIGRKTFDAIKPYLTVSGETTLHVAGKAKGKDGEARPGSNP